MKKKKRIATLKAELESLEPNRRAEPVSISVDDSARIRAALNLSEAVKDLASVIAGNTVSVNISHCNFDTSGGDKSAIHIEGRAD